MLQSSYPPIVFPEVVVFIVSNEYNHTIQVMGLYCMRVDPSVWTAAC